VNDDIEKKRAIRNALKVQMKLDQALLRSALEEHRRAKAKYLEALDRWLRVRASFRAMREEHRRARLDAYQLQTAKVEE